MEKILVPTDFSDCARSAENIGLEIAKKANAEIHFLHILSTSLDWVNLSIEKEKLYPETKVQIGYAKDELNKLVSRSQKLNLKAEQFLTFDKGREEIDQQIKNFNYDFIVMGSHGTKGLQEIIGSNTQKVVRHSHVPVLVVKEKPKKNSFKNILFASTFEEDIHKSFHKIIEFADIMGAHIHLLYVNLPSNFKETDEIEKNMQAFLNKCSRGTYTMNTYNAINEEKGIQKFADKIKADVIALTTHGKTGLMKILSPSITENLVNHADMSILSVNINTK